MKNSLFRKGLVFSIIVLFVGASVIPNVLAQDDNISNAEDIVLTSKVYGSNGFKSKIVSVTQYQYDEIEQLFNSIQQRIDETTTRTEMVAIFQEAVATLDKYHLLPHGINAKQAQSLVTNGIPNPNYSYLGRFIQSNNLDLNSYDNMLCLTVGMTDETIFLGGPLMIGLVYLLYALDNGANSLFYMLATIARILCDISPVSLAHLVCIGYRSGRPIIPAEGWLTTVGLKGVKTWNDYLYGTFNDMGLLLGIIGFTGIHLYNPIGKHFYLGSSLLVKKTEY